MCDLSGQELEEALELVAVAADRRRELRRIRVRPLERAHLELQAPAEALDPAEHADGVALVEAPVEELDVAPHPRLDATARVDELEREVRLARLRRAPLLARDGVGALDRAVGLELADRGHREESRRWCRPGRSERRPRPTASGCL